MSEVLTIATSASQIDKPQMDAVIVTQHSAQSADAGLKYVMQLSLNAPESLNALSLDMVRIIRPLLDSWRNDERVACIVLDGMGDKGFCAGGDIRSLYAGMVAPEPQLEQPSYCQQFFAEEYQLDYLIHCYEKPLICWGSGIVIGGGLGLMAGANHRVVTETTRISMPEVSIGLFPDVGGTWFLNHMPKPFGLFFALTASQINGNDARVLGLADHAVSSEDKTRMMRDLCQHHWGTSLADQHQAVEHIMSSLEKRTLARMPDSKVLQHFDIIHQVMGHGHLTSVLDALNRLGECSDPWLQKIPQVLKHASPLAIAVSARQLQKGQHQSLAEVFCAELSLAINLSEMGDFAEGIRALLIDKDRQPKWRYDSLDAIESEYLDKLFSSRWTAAQHPLRELITI